MGVELGYNLSLIQMNVVVVRGSVHGEDARYACFVCSFPDRCSIVYECRMVSDGLLAARHLI